MRDINQDGIKLSQLRALVAIADHSNFSEAALHLAVSQSAVSHAIATLEEELGIVLFSRGRHGARLTSVGERVTEHARQMLQLLDRIGREANLAKGLQGGQVRVGSFRSAATHLLPEVVAKFRSRFPAIAVAIIECQNVSEIEQVLRKGQIDVGFTYIPTSTEFEAWELLRDEYVVLLPPNVQLLNACLTWEQLATYPMIMPPADDHCRFLVHNHFAQLGQTINPTYEIREDSTIVNMVVQGLGATIIARLAAEPLPPGVRVCRLPVPLERVIGVAALVDALHPPAVFAFLDTLKEMYQDSNQTMIAPNPMTLKTG